MPDIIHARTAGVTDAELLMQALKQAREVTAVVIKCKELERLPKLLQRRLLKLDGHLETAVRLQFNVMRYGVMQVKSV